MSFGGSFATDAIPRGVPERHLQRFLGHASIQSTRRYARLADNALIEVLRVPSRRTSIDDEPAEWQNWDARRRSSRRASSLCLLVLSQLAELTLLLRNPLLSKLGSASDPAAAAIGLRGV